MRRGCGGTDDGVLSTRSEIAALASALAETSAFFDVPPILQLTLYKVYVLLRNV